MKELLPFVIVGVTTGSLYGLAGVGLVLTYRTSGVFNFGHGAIAAAAAYIFYDLHVTRELPWAVAAVIAVLGFGVVAGVVVERVTRRLVGAPEALLVVATVGILLTINGVLQLRFGSRARAFPQFLPTGAVTVGGVNVSYAQIISVVVACACVGGLYTFLRVSRLGLAMRAVVENPALLSLSGAGPVRVRTLAWMVGSVFASLSGILVAPTIGLDSFLLTLLVVQAFGACAIGSFKSLPLTYAGGLVVGVLASLATKYLPSGPPYNGIPASIPFLVLLAVLLFIPARKLPANRAAFRGLASRRQRVDLRLAAPLALVLGAGLLLVPHAVGTKLPLWISALTMVVMFGSLALLTWTSGQISLCHTAFAALGATTLSRLTVDHGVPWALALVLSGLAAVPLGALVAIPAIRVTGVYLALATFGFAVVTQNVLYGTDLMFGDLPRRDASRPVLGFIDGRSDTGLYYIVLAVAVLSCACLAAINRGRLGRLLRGMSETTTMLSTHGLNVNLTRLTVFCISAFFAGIAGALTITQASAVSPVTFQPIQSLLWLAVLALCGTRLLSSSVLAAVLLALVPAYISGVSFEQQTIGFGALAVIATIIVANASRIGAYVRRAAAESDHRRAASPVLARQRRKALAPAAALAGAAPERGRA